MALRKHHSDHEVAGFALWPFCLAISCRAAARSRHSARHVPCPPSQNRVSMMRKRKGAQRCGEAMPTLALTCARLVSMAISVWS